MWNGETNLVHLTVATEKGEPLDPNTTLYTNLRTAINNARDPNLPVVLQGHNLVRFRLSAKILVDSNQNGSGTSSFLAVKSLVESMLQTAFSFENRQFGESVTAASVITAIQQVPGVVGVDLDSLYRDGQPAILNPILPSATAGIQGTTYYPAELLLIHPYGVELTEMIP